MEQMRTHVVLPRELVDEIDQLVGPRKRSEFIAEALEEKVKRVRRVRAAEAVAGSLADVDIPGWETTESTVAWVHNLRHSGDRPIPDFSEPEHASRTSS